MARVRESIVVFDGGLRGETRAYEVEGTSLRTRSCRAAAGDETAGHVPIRTSVGGGPLPRASSSSSAASGVGSSAAIERASPSKKSMMFS